MLLFSRLIAGTKLLGQGAPRKNLHLTTARAFVSCTIGTTAGTTGAWIKLSEFVRDKISLDRLRLKLEIELKDILRVC
jgi:hypothetical protein